MNVGEISNNNNLWKNNKKPTYACELMKPTPPKTTNTHSLKSPQSPTISCQVHLRKLANTRRSMSRAMANQCQEMILALGITVVRGRRIIWMSRVRRSRSRSGMKKIKCLTNKRINRRGLWGQSKILSIIKHREMNRTRAPTWYLIRGRGRVLVSLSKCIKLKEAPISLF